jgi:oligoribonuclease NrnB/cAMP/cGMP phosphodiesterase (DHH superfamily)
MQNITCIYHKNCVDGTTAAAVVLRRYPHAQLFPLSHGYTEEAIEEIFSKTPNDAHIYIVDATLGIEECVARGHTVTVIDHHVSAHTDMHARADIHESITYIFDNEKSGASLTWSYLFPHEPLPEIIRYVEDSDLWKQAFGDVTKDVNHYLSIWRNNPAQVLAFIQGDAAILKERGATISQYTDHTVAHLVETKPIILRIGTHAVLAFNITDHESACGHILSLRHNQAVALFTIKGDTVTFSFRSITPQTPSALDLALLADGGGNRNSAGGRIALTDFISRIVHLDPTEIPSTTH